MNKLRSRSQSPNRGRALLPVALFNIFVMLSLNAESVYCLDANNIEDSEGSLAFLRAVESTLEIKTMWFYRHFGANIDPSKINRASRCDYSDSRNIKNCPPSFDEQIPMQNPNLYVGAKAGNDNALSLKNRSSFISIPARCLEDPDDPDCRDLRALGDNDTPLPGITKIDDDNDLAAFGVGVPSTAPDTDTAQDAFLSAMPSPPVGAMNSDSPSQNMCFGNHETEDTAGYTADESTHVKGKWCESSMPSVSLEPSGAPSKFPEGGIAGAYGARAIRSEEPTGLENEFPQGAKEGGRKYRSSKPSAQPTTRDWSPPPAMVFKGSGKSAPPSGEPSEQPSRYPSVHPSVHPSYQPSGSTSEQPTSKLIEQPVDESDEQPVEQPVEQPSDESEEQPAEQPSDESEEQPAEQPSEESEEQPAEQPSDESEEQPAEPPSDESEKQPAEPPSDESEEQPAEQPSDELEEPPPDEPLLGSNEPPPDQPLIEEAQPPPDEPLLGSNEPPPDQPLIEEAQPPPDEPLVEAEEPPVDQPSDEPEEPPAQQPIEQPVEEPDEPVDQPTDQPIEEPDEPVDQPTDQPVKEPDEPVDQPTDQPVEEPDEPVDQPTDQPVEEPDEPVDQPTDQPIEEPDEPVDQPTDQPVEEPDEPVDQPTDQPVEEPDEPVDQPTDQPIEEPDEPVDQPTDQPVEEPDEPVDQPTVQPVEEQDEPVDQPTEQPVEEPDEPVDQPTEQPVEEPDEPVDQPTEQPVEEPDEPVDQPTEQPVEQPIEQPTEVSISPSSDGPSESVEPTMLPSLVCEDDFVRFNQDGLGIPTDSLICIDEDESILLPGQVPLVSQSNEAIGSVNFEFACAFQGSSEIRVTLTLNDGHFLTGDSKISILTPSEQVLVQTDFVEWFQNADGWISTLPLSREGRLLVRVLTEVNGEVVAVSNGDQSIDLCFDCGWRSAKYAGSDVFLEHGFLVNAYSDNGGYTGGENLNLPRYMHTQLHQAYNDFDTTFVNEAVDTCLIIQESDTETPKANVGGGSIVFNFTDTTDELFEIELFNIQGGATIYARANNEIFEFPIEPALNQVQNVALNIPGVDMVTVQFEGPGAICAIRTCMQGTRSPSDGNNLAPSPGFFPSVSPTLVESYQPTNCYDLYGITESDIIEQTGSDEPIPEDSIRVVSGANTTLTLEITQLWSENVNLNFFIHYHSNTHETVCEAIPDFSYQNTTTKDLECYNGWTDVGIFIYLDELTLEECEECKPPESDEENIIAYYFELPCEPICESPEPTESPVTEAPSTIQLESSSAPTDCYDLYNITESDIIEQTGSDEPIPEDSIRVINKETANITLEITQLWSENVNLNFFIHYHSNTHETVCEAIPDFSYQNTTTKDLECYNGWTDVGIFIYLDELTLEECEECKPPESDEENIIAYYFELPCELICESPEPTESPVTEAPSTIQLESSSAPTDCYDLYNITESDIIEQTGSDEPIPEDSIRVINKETANITLEITQLWSENVNLNFFIHYHSNTHETVCEAIPDFSYQNTTTKDLKCYNGWTDVGIFIYLDELTLEECEECKPPESDEENIIAYYFELPCEPICGSKAPTEAPVIEVPRNFLPPQTDCFDQVNVNVADKKPESISIGSEIISITELNSDSIVLDVVVRDDYEMISVGYDDAQNHHRQCYQDFNVLGGEKIPINAACYENFASLTVIFYIGENFDRTSCDACSLPSGDIEDFVAITFEVPCDPITCEPSSSPSPSPMLDSSSSRKLSSFTREISSTTSSMVSDEADCYHGITAKKKGTLCNGGRRLDTGDMNVNASIVKGHMTAEMNTVASEKVLEEDAPYCSHEEFPCEGDVEAMVHVCYYSSQSGYHTFCIPEVDSEILRFHENHHCGPCEGWNGEERTIQMM